MFLLHYIKKARCRKAGENMDLFKNLERHKAIKKQKTKGPYTAKDRFSRGYIVAADDYMKPVFPKSELSAITNGYAKSAKEYNDPFFKGYMAFLGDYAKHQRKRGYNIYGEKRSNRK